MWDTARFSGSRVWYTVDDALSLPPGAVVENYAHLEETGELLVTAASLDDMGVFTCVAINTVGSTRGRGALRVLGESGRCWVRVARVGFGGVFKMLQTRLEHLGSFWILCK